MAFAPHQWDENQGARIGAGISRPRDKERTKAYVLMVSTNGAPPMRWSTQAPTASKAKEYALARWPNSKVIVLK